MCLSVICFCFDCVRVFCAADTKLGPRRGCTPRTKACFTKKVVKQKQNKSENCKKGGKSIPYVAFMLITVGQRPVRRRKEEGDGRFCGDDTERQERCACARRKQRRRARQSPQPKTPRPSSFLLPTTTVSLFLAKKHFPSAKNKIKCPLFSQRQLNVFFPNFLM
jgi:hypothetical protein